MSHSIDERYEAYIETLRVARKAHVCAACAEPIAPGHRYYTIRIVYQGIEGLKRCLKCQAIHEHLRGLEPGEMWPAEKLDCGEDYEEHWGGEPPAEIAALAFMTPEEAQRELV